MSKRVIFYGSKWCEYCAADYPKVVQTAQKLGYSVEKVDVDRCPVNLKERCNKIEWVPTVELDGKIMSVQEFQKKAKQESV